MFVVRIWVSRDPAENQRNMSRKNGIFVLQFLRNASKFGAIYKNTFGEICAVESLWYHSYFEFHYSTRQTLFLYAKSINCFFNVHFETFLMYFYVKELHFPATFRRSLWSLFWGY